MYSLRDELKLGYIARKIVF